MKAAAYLRVSTETQTVDNQLPDIQRRALALGYPHLAIYAENESAWRVGHQHELARLLAGLKSSQHHYEVLFVWSLDRLTRQGIPAIFELINTLSKYGCRVISLRESWTEVIGPAYDLFLALTAWIAKFESDRQSERVRAGLARAVAAGRGKRGKDRKVRKRRVQKHPGKFSLDSVPF